jgi:hypothetical protein
MGFASAYLDERALFPEIINEAPDKDTGIIVVVPSYDEPNIRNLLNSLITCSVPSCRIEVIVVVNAPEDASAESLQNNKETLLNIESWKKENSNNFFRLFSFNAEPAPVSKWGVGLARKAGMDEAVRRFNRIDKPEGVILNLDADCRVESNYFLSVCDDFLFKKERAACSIFFEHPLAGSDFTEKIYRYITLYELHLRYYYQGLALSGFPYVFHTIGSALGVKAYPYVKAGGMNRRQAGEDFYFIQKLVPAGGYFSLNSTTVYPSPRPSFRVPFGTGASVGRLNESIEPGLMTYNLSAFKELASFFSMAESFFNFRTNELAELYNLLPVGLKSFIDENEFFEKLTEIKKNTSGFLSFKKRFFGWFNMFKIVKYLNHVHSGIFEKMAVLSAAKELVQEIGGTLRSEDPAYMLNFFRLLERERNR